MCNVLFYVIFRFLENFLLAQIWNHIIWNHHTCDCPVLSDVFNTTFKSSSPKWPLWTWYSNLSNSFSFLCFHFLYFSRKLSACLQSLSQASRQSQMKPMPATFTWSSLDLRTHLSKEAHLDLNSFYQRNIPWQLLKYVLWPKFIIQTLTSWEEYVLTFWKVSQYCSLKIYENINHAFHHHIRDKEYIVSY